MLSRKLRQPVRIIDIERTDIGDNDGLCSEIEQLVVRYTPQNGGDGAAADVVTLISKTPHSASSYGQLHELGLYANELYLYETVVPYVNTVLGESIVPDYYGTDERQTLIIERFPSGEYKSRRNEQQLDYKHCVLVFEALAKFHAASYKFRQTNPDRAANILGSSPNGQRFIGRVLDARFVQAIDDVLRRENVADDVIDRLKSIAERMPEILHKEVNNRFEFVVLNHGDAKTGNFLFKYGDDDDDDEPIDVKMIDFQLARWCSPAFDLLFLSMSSMGYEVYENHFDKLLDRYVTVLNETLARLHLANVRYTRKNLADDMRSLRYYQYVNLFFMPYFMCDPKIIESCMNGGSTFEQAVRDICKDRKLMKLIVQLVDRVTRADNV